jgi:hypothetical protein
LVPGMIALTCCFLPARNAQRQHFTEGRRCWVQVEFFNGTFPFLRREKVQARSDRSTGVTAQHPIISKRFSADSSLQGRFSNNLVQSADGVKESPGLRGRSPVTILPLW